MLNRRKKNEDEIIKIVAKVGIEGENVLVKIKDYGKGIPEDVQDNIFKPNFTTKSTGMGLGLAIVNNIILNAQGSPEKNPIVIVSCSESSKNPFTERSNSK